PRWRRPAATISGISSASWAAAEGKRGKKKGSPPPPQPPQPSKEGPLPRPPFPLVKFPCCQIRTAVRLVSQSKMNPDRVFYKCPNHGRGGCNFFH
ncbi:hypothetical protein BRADI_1g21966v3, partial [Brachypodium distachyon]